MGETDSDNECHMKHRIIPRITPIETNKKFTLKEDARKERKNRNGCEKCDDKKETTEERIERISKVKVSIVDFFIQCLDHDMLKLFCQVLVGFLGMCAFVSIIYVTLVYMFKPNLWNIYFPKQEHSEDFHKEL